MAGRYSFFTSNEIRPNGWLRRQLEIQASGLAGNLDRMWPDVRDSMWIGGNREGWERVPYWLDGFIPLAYLLDDGDMKARAKRYVDKILEFQKPDGWICPNGDTPIEKYDTWAVLLISKVLTVYYECSKDERVPDAVWRIMKNFYDLLDSRRISLFEWSEHRWFEGFVALNLLHRLYPDEEWIGALAKILKEQGTDYESVKGLWKRPLNKWTQDTHIVNLTMMLKSEALSCDLLGEEYTDLAERLHAVLKQYNGTAVGTFTGDECLAGISPIQGTELCSVVELMYSYEWLYAYTGDKKWAERLEQVSFNALPATVSEDMWTHQYCQLVNQIDCTPFPAKPIFRTNGKQAHLFGLEPHYGCCTANFGQGWPKLALSTFMRAKDGALSAVPIPSELSADWRGVPVRITLDTEYPFRNKFTYRINADKKTDMKLHIRVPSFAKNLCVNGKATPKRSMLTFGGFDAGETVITLSYEAEPHLAARPKGLYAVEYGSLVFSVPVKSEAKKVEYVKNDVERKYPYCDYHIKGVSDWNLALASRNFSVEEGEIGEIPFSESAPALTLKTELCHIDWGYEEGYETVCAKIPESRRPTDAPAKATLIPYGCTTLRMTELPLVKPKI
ncbi:MAG: glycoside hydrolase family 127 protein [Clostridia bacterium]|nr:glycoside hydrolase family 127 protein [Clostridia bacterium]